MPNTTAFRLLRYSAYRSKQIFAHDVNQAFVSTWSFPTPDPPPQDSDVISQGLPFLRKVVEHADRPFLSVWPPSEPDQRDTDHQTLSYQDVISKAIQISIHVQQRASSLVPSPFLAHSTLPCSDYIACQWGAFAANKASVPLSISQKTAELEHVLQDSNPVMIIVSDKVPNYDQVLQAAHNLRMMDRIVPIEQVTTLDSSFLSEETPEATQLMETAAPSPSLDQPALLLYTSGTTGKPKGVLHTHRNLYHQITDLVAAWEWQPQDVALHVLPLHHVHGVVNILSCAAYVGAQVQFQTFDPYKLWSQWAHHPLPHLPHLEKHPDSDEPSQQGPVRPTVFMAVPTIYSKLLEAAHQMSPDLIQQAVERTLYPMRLHVSGSAALPTKVLEDWRQLTSHTLLERYGMTEFAMALSNPYNEVVAPRLPGHVGIPLQSVQVRLVDATTKEVVYDDNGKEEVKGPVSGILQVKGPTVFQEYWNRPDATKEAFTLDGYFDTGDEAEYNPQVESYRILGRASVDILKVGGNKLSALEIERVLLEHANMAEVVIVGIPDDVWGQRVGMIARCKAEPPMSLEQLQEWCGPRMEKIQTPTRLLWLSEIPKNAMGKVNKKELVRLFDQEMGT